MFYEDTMDERFRFGDVIKGFTTATPVVNNPPLTALNNNFQIEISQAQFYAVLSPCCSINEKLVVLCPLIRLRSQFTQNPYLLEDFNRINMPMNPQQSVPPQVWERLPEPEREKRIAVGFSYAFVDLFVYAEHPLFPKYILRTSITEIETQHYMVDFRQTFTVRCEKVTRQSTPFENVKLLQLSIEARKELRNKMAAYFSRIPEEDKVLVE